MRVYPSVPELMALVDTSEGPLEQPEHFVAAINKLRPSLAEFILHSIRPFVLTYFRPDDMRDPNAVRLFIDRNSLFFFEHIHKLIQLVAVYANLEVAHMKHKDIPANTVPLSVTAFTICVAMAITMKRTLSQRRDDWMRDTKAAWDEHCSDDDDDDPPRVDKPDNEPVRVSTCNIDESECSPSTHPLSCWSPDLRCKIMSTCAQIDDQIRAAPTAQGRAIIIQDYNYSHTWSTAVPFDAALIAAVKEYIKSKDYRTTHLFWESCAISVEECYITFKSIEYDAVAGPLGKHNLLAI